MALTDELGIDVATFDPTKVDDQMKSGGLPPKGLYHAILDGAREGTANTGTKFRELFFKIVGGPHAGSKVKYTLYFPSPSQEDAEKTAKAKTKVVMFMHRLGLLVKNGSGYVATPGKADFTDAIGTACIINVSHRTYKTNDGGEGVAADLAYEGVLSLDDDRAKNVVRGNPAAVAGHATAAAATGVQRQQDQQFAGQ